MEQLRDQNIKIIVEDIPAYHGRLRILFINIGLPPKVTSPIIGALYKLNNVSGHSGSGKCKIRGSGKIAAARSQLPSFGELISRYNHGLFHVSTVCY